ncbi:MAG: hypothetical protein U0W40_02110 [Acidimicrobiia bacterium]
MAAIMIPTGSDRIDRRHTVTITTNRPTSRRQPTTAPVRRPSVATGRTLGGGAGVAVRTGARPAVRQGPAHRPVSRATYWCRRAFVAALVVGLVLLMAQAGAALGGSSLATPERSTTSSSASPVRHTVVRPGDSLWSVASRLAPGSDPRPVVDALSQARDGAALVPGETVEWGG